jgi:hypothetical protein
VVELNDVVSRGARASQLEPIIERLPKLCSLACVRYAAAPGAHDLARRIVDVLERVDRRLPVNGGLQAGFAVLFALDPTYRLAKASTRREKAAEQLFHVGMSADTFMRRHQADALSVVADEILGFEDEFRMRATRQLLEDDDAPVFTALAVQWLTQFEHYHRIMTDMIGLYNDITVYLSRKRKDPDYEPLASYHTSSLWYLARLQLNIDRFVDERGGIWMFSDKKIETAIIDSVYLSGWHVPFSEREQSLLKLALMLPAVGPTLVLFERSMLDVGEGREALTKWADFLDSCECDLEDPSSDCEVHLLVRHAERYRTLVEAEWDKVAGWYRHPQQLSAGDSSAARIFRDFDASHWEY